MIATATQDQLHQRSFAQERLTALAASGDGAYLAAGGASGALYVWEAATGQLLRTWAAHYKVRGGGGERRGRLWAAGCLDIDSPLLEGMLGS